ncbi:MAG: KilA-N domain-containing protein [Bacteroidetes bacterium]|nr:KilA-N domain-containing protein [Bacteroidota bacterium]
MADILKFDYEGQKISFEFADGNKMINATEMAKPFGKRVNDFLRQQGTQEYIVLLEDRYGNSRNGTTIEVLRVVQGGLSEIQGTWMDEKLALKFAAWLSPAFELWVYDKIQELLTTGKTELKEVPPTGFSATLRLLAQQWEAQEKINTEVRKELDDTAERLDELEAKILSTDEKYYTIAGYCALNGIACPLHLAKEWGKKAVALSTAKQFPTGSAHDEKYGKVRTYHVDVLSEVIK